MSISRITPGSPTGTFINLSACLASSPFDDEGTPRQVTPLVERGVLRNFVYDLDTAGRAGARPTGHGAHPGQNSTTISTIAATPISTH